MSKLKVEIKITAEGEASDSPTSSAKQIAREMRALIAEGPLSDKGTRRVAVAVARGAASPGRPSRPRPPHKPAATRASRTAKKRAKR